MIDAVVSTRQISPRIEPTLASVGQENDKRTGAKIGLPGLPLKKATVVSVCYRLHQLHGESPTTWENRMSGEVSDYKQVARMNRELIGAGMTEKVAELMAVIDASLSGQTPITLHDALHEAEIADCMEQIADESFRDKLRRGTASVSDAREYVRKSAHARTKAEKAEAETLTWISQQETK
jgi:hypothetical protein